MLDSFEEALKDFSEGKMVVMVDDEARENEGDLVFAAEWVTPEKINFMAREGRGLICVPMSGDMLERLDLKQMVSDNTDPNQTAFTVSVDATDDISTGISAQDRSRTVEVLVDEGSRPEDLRKPGHVFPLCAKEGGVLVRAGQTEGSVDMARLAGLKPAAVICEIMKDDGTMARLPELRKFADKHNIKLVSIEQIIRYRHKNCRLVKRAAEAVLPTEYGEFRIVIFENNLDKMEHLALVYGDIENREDILVRVHSECLTGDVFASRRCDCGSQLHAAMRQIAAEGSGVLLYMRQEGRGIGLTNKIKAYHLQDNGYDTVEANEALGFAADLRDYGLGAQMLRDLGLTTLRVMTNNPRKIVGLEGYGLKVTSRVPLVIPPGEENRYYLETKRIKLHHYLPDDAG